MPQFATAFGKRFRSCKGVRVTEEDTEYVIFCVKHIYDAHILLQFNCTNTISDQVCLSPWGLPPFSGMIPEGKAVPYASQVSTGAITDVLSDNTVSWRVSLQHRTAVCAWRSTPYHHQSSVVQGACSGKPCSS